jgi:hypothetical protein
MKRRMARMRDWLTELDFIGAILAWRDSGVVDRSRPARAEADSGTGAPPLKVRCRYPGQSKFASDID